MYTLYTDKSEDFTCNIGIEGAILSNTQARLVLESQDLNLLFEGKINSEGKCVIPIKQLKSFLNEGATGNLKLEVIADGSYFTPWEDNFTLKTHKKVTVEVDSKNEKSPISEIQVRVEMPTKKLESQTEPQKEAPFSHGKVLSEVLGNKNITRSNFTTNLVAIKSLVENYIKRHNVQQPLEKVLLETINNLKK
tara:strand:- start:5757 stop:6335 length:579 start_codon:yes stop_codon:yes gene_type:complete